MDGPALQVLLLKFCSPEDQSLAKNLYLYHVVPESIHVNGSLYFTTPPSFALEMYSCCGCWWWDKRPAEHQVSPQVSLPLPCTGSKEPKLPLRGQPSSLPGQPCSNGSLQSCRTHRHFWARKHRNTSVGSDKYLLYFFNYYCSDIAEFCFRVHLQAETLCQPTI